MNKQQIKDLALSNGFKLKQQPSGEMDLNPYVYEFSNALLSEANERVAEQEIEISSLRSGVSGDLLAKYKEAQERIEELENQLQITTLTTHEASFESEYGKERLNKFAIEKKIEGAYAVISLLDETKDSKAILLANNYVREQLRKEKGE